MTSSDDVYHPLTCYSESATYLAVKHKEIRVTSLDAC